ncbi:MAG TPA: VIT domain-containing protein [Opitutaceae bacterium]|nr:VIT domain-containing protein [Opitutaceae bacterium]
MPRAFAVALFWILFSISFTPLRAAEAEPAADKTLSPYFWVKPTAGETDATVATHADPLPLKATKIEATIAGIFADVKVTQRYANAGAVPLEAVYIFPGSTRAAVHGLTLQIGDRRLEAKTKEREQARQTYEAAKAKGQTASLLEQHRPNVFQINVANIQPGDDVIVELRYTELLIPEAGVYQFVYPGVVGPRYSNKPAGGAPPSEKWVENPYLKKGETDPAQFSLSVKLSSGVPLRDVQCRSHAAHVEYQAANQACIEISDTNAANRDFILDYRLAGPAVQSGVMLGSGLEENFFLLTVQPPARVKPAQIPPREFDFVIDVSGSMNGFPLDTARKLVDHLLTSLRPIDSFNLLLFAGGDQTFAPAAVKATPENVAAALAFLERQNGGGATELCPALKHAFALKPAEEISRTFLVITDGYVDVEPEAFELVRNNLGRANLFAFGIGSSVNRHLIEGLARCGQGEPFIVTDPAMAEATAQRLQDYISTPVLAHVRVKFEGFDVYDLQPRATPDLLAERPLIVFGKWHGAASGKIVIDGIGGSGPYHSEHDVASAVHLETGDGLARLWARARVAELSDFNELKPSDDTKAQITNLGLKYNLLTKYTSFIAVDQVIRRTGPSLETIKQPVPLPAGVENSAVGGSVAAAPEPSEMGMIAVVAILLLVGCRYVARRKTA